MDLKHTKAIIFSLEGPELSKREAALFKKAKPLGFILFGRNCENPDQIKALTKSLRDCVGWGCPILIDQEGGRVQRLKPPVWPGYPSMRMFGAKAEVHMNEGLQTLGLIISQLSHDLRESGINVNCAPVLDVLSKQTHEAIGDRAFSSDPEIVAKLGLEVCKQLMEHEIIPVIKHLPGHGRASADSHKDLPRVEASLEELRAHDFVPFKAIAESEFSDAVWGMAAHIIYSAIDSDLPSSASPKVIEEIIRGEIGFDGLLLSDDLEMQALAGLGDMSARTQAVLEAGCDAALHCSGKFEEMEKIANSVPNLSAKAQQRLQKSLKSLKLAA